MSQTPRVTCDMRAASDTPEQRAGEYQRLFDTALCGRERTERMVRFRFRTATVDEAQVRSLAAREQACCPFFSIQIKTSGDELWWETRVDDTPQVKAMLDELYRLPDQHHRTGTATEDLIERGLLVTAAVERPADTPPPPVAGLDLHR